MDKAEVIRELHRQCEEIISEGNRKQGAYLKPYNLKSILKLKWWLSFHCVKMEEITKASGKETLKWVMYRTG